MPQTFVTYHFLVSFLVFFTWHEVHAYFWKYWVIFFDAWWRRLFSSIFFTLVHVYFESVFKKKKYSKFFIRSMLKKAPENRMLCWSKFIVIIIAMLNMILISAQDDFDDFVTFVSSWTLQRLLDWFKNHTLAPILS